MRREETFAGFADPATRSSRTVIVPGARVSSEVPWSVSSARASSMIATAASTALPAVRATPRGWGFLQAALGFSVVVALGLTYLRAEGESPRPSVNRGEQVVAPPIATSQPRPATGPVIYAPMHPAGGLALAPPSMLPSVSRRARARRPGPALTPPTLERLAADAVHAGELARAATIYAELAARSPENPAFLAAARLLAPR